MTSLMCLFIFLFRIAQPIPHESVLTKSMETGAFEMISLGNLPGWKFISDDNPAFALPEFDDSTWLPAVSDSTGRVSAPQGLWQGIGWFRVTVTTDSTFYKPSALMLPVADGATEIYINGEKVVQHGSPAASFSQQIIPGRADHSKAVLSFLPNSEYTIAVRYSFVAHQVYQKLSFGYLLREQSFAIEVYDEKRSEYLQQRNNFLSFTLGVAISVLLLVLVLHVALYNVSKKDASNIWVIFMTSIFLLIALSTWLPIFVTYVNGINYALIRGFSTVLFFVLASFTPYATGKLLGTSIRPWWGHLRWAAAFYFVLLTFFPQLSAIPIVRLFLSVSLFGVIILGCFQALKASKRQGNPDTWLIALALISFPVWYLLGSIFFIFLQIDAVYGISFVQMMMMISLPILFSVYQGKKFITMHNNMEGLVEERTRQLADKNERLENANEEIQQQRDEVVKARDGLERSLEHLKATQDQLIQQEKLASLGQLTAGIAHEIKNPLNFVNNFSEVSMEMIDEIREELSELSAELSDADNGKISDTLSILNDIEANLKTIHKHGTRADSIVKSMLQHSKGSDGKKTPTDLNALVKEYVNLSYHGMRAGKNPIDVDIEFDLDDAIGEVPLIAEDFSRVIVNLANNAIDACREKLSVIGSQLSAISSRPSEDLESTKQAYAPKVRITTKLIHNGGKVANSQQPIANSQLLIAIEDNGSGIPDEIKDKILQPFFTTKKGTEGTGLGLSITHDIIKAHGGELIVASIKNEKTVFSIRLPK